MNKWAAYPALVLKVWVLLLGLMCLAHGQPFDILIVLVLIRMQYLQKQMSA